MPFCRNTLDDVLDVYFGLVPTIHISPYAYHIVNIVLSYLKDKNKLILHGGLNCNLTSYLRVYGGNMVADCESVNEARGNRQLNSKIRNDWKKLNKYFSCVHAPAPSQFLFIWPPVLVFHFISRIRLVSIGAIVFNIVFLVCLFVSIWNCFPFFFCFVFAIVTNICRRK